MFGNLLLAFGPPAWRATRCHLAGAAGRDLRRRRVGLAPDWSRVAPVVKRRIALGLLGFVALWPLAHRALVARFELDPWKHSGFAMRRASLPVLAAVLRRRRAGCPAGQATRLQTRAALDRFRVERLALRRRRPEDVARAMFAARPELTGLVVRSSTRLEARS
jgi:hypothetical protein